MPEAESLLSRELLALLREPVDLGPAARARVMRAHGASVSDLARHSSATVTIEQYEELGYNYRMTDIQAAIGLALAMAILWLLMVWPR